MSIGVVILVPLALKQAGGLSDFVNNAPAGFFGISAPEYDWIYIVLLILMVTLSTASFWSYIQRFYCVPRERDVVKLSLMVVALEVIGPPLILLPAMAAKQFLSPDIDAAQVYPLLCIQVLPVGLVGLIIAAMFSATMSMLSSDYNVCASVLTNDVYRRVIRPQASVKELVLVGRLSTLLIGCIAVVVAWFVNRTSGAGGDKLFRNMVTLFSIAVAPIAIPMVLGLFSRKMTNRGALTGFLCGLAAGCVVFAYVPDEIEVMNILLKLESLLFLTTSTITLIVMVIVSYLWPGKAKENEKIDSFLARLRIPIGQMDGDVSPPVGPGSLFSPFHIVGAALSCVGLMLAVLLPFMVKNRLAFGLNAAFALVLLTVGAVMLLRKERKQKSD